MSEGREVAGCGRCGASFLEVDHLALHQGRAHDLDAGTPEHERYEAALGREEAWLVELRRHALGTVHALPFVLFYVFFVIVAAVNDIVYWAVLPAPGVVIFGLLVYYMAYTQDQAPPRPKS
jgi:hypothetical protein